MSTWTAVSFGGGVNSTAMLVGMAIYGQRPDQIIFADTGGEHPDTYRFINRVSEWCDAMKFPEIQFVRYNSRHGTLEQECLNNETLPSKAFGNAGCSVKWKRQPIDKAVAETDGAKAAWAAGNKVKRLIGIHYGEVRRGQIPHTEQYEFVYPLRLWKWDQKDCERMCLIAFGKIPNKSSCFFCPAMKLHEVIQLNEKSPDLANRAIDMEINAKPNLDTVKGLGRNWSWQNAIAANDAQRKLFHNVVEGHCASGECGD